MAIDAHSTPAPTDHRALLRTHGAPCRVLTEAEVFAEIGENPELPPEPSLPAQDAAQTRHMRRALEGALDHGTALLAALGLPRLIEPGFVPLDPAAIGDALDHAIATLDGLDAPGADLEDDGMAEPSLGWIDGKPVLSDSHDDREAEDDDEPILGAPERHPSCYQFALCDATSSQEHWADGSARNDEAEAVNDVNAGLIPGQRGGVKPGQWIGQADMERAPIGALSMSA